MDIIGFVRLGQDITNIYQSKHATWDPFGAVAHAHAELSEVFEVLRNKKDKNGKSRYGPTYSEGWYNTLSEEVADAVISALTPWEIVPGTTSQKLADMIEHKITKVYDRAINYRAEKRN